MSWSLDELFTAGYAIAGNHASFYAEDDTQISDLESNHTVVYIGNQVTMPSTFASDSATLVSLFRAYGPNNNMSYSVSSRDDYGVSADRQSYLCHVLSDYGLHAYTNGISDTSKYDSFTLAQILSHAIDCYNLIAINPTSIEDLTGSIIKSGDIILCRTQASTTVDALYGIGDIYMWDDNTQTGLKWTSGGLTETKDILHPAVVFRPLLETYGLYNMGRTQFDNYINTSTTKYGTGNIYQYSNTGSSTGITGCSGTGGSITTTTAKKYIWIKLVQATGNEYAAAGIMGNLAHESAFMSNNLQNSYEKSLGYTDAEYTAAVDNGTYTNFVNDSAGYGLAQWTYYTRKQNLLNYANQQGTSIGDLAMQVDFLVNELKGYGFWSELCAATSIRDASNYILLKFERPADQSEAVQTKRANSGQEVYNEFHGTDTNTDVSLNTTAQPTGTSTTTASSSSAYEGSGLLYDTTTKMYSATDTSGWDVSKWDTGYYITSGPGPRWTRVHAGTDMVPKNGNWNRYTVAKAQILSIQRNVTTHWINVDDTYQYWYEESNPSVQVPSAQCTDTAGTNIKYKLLDGSDITVWEMHYISDSIPSSLAVGDVIDAGTFIGIGGNTGKSTGRHIHFQLNNAQGHTIDPEAWLKARLNITVNN